MTIQTNRTRAEENRASVDEDQAQRALEEQAARRAELEEQSARAPEEVSDGGPDPLAVGLATLALGPLGGLAAAYLTRGSGQDGNTGGSGGADQTQTPPAPAATVAVTAPATVTLGDQMALSAAVSGGAGTAYTFEISRTTGGGWFQLGTGAAAQLNATARAAGNMKIRARVQVGTSNVTSNEAPVVIQFMDLTTVKTNATCVGWFNTAWTETKAATSDGSRREQGFWIQFNSTNGTYQKAGVTVGNTVANNQGAALNGFPAAPADSPVAPVPNVGGVFTVAWYHTHTPTLYRTGGRGTGPSGGDYGWSTAYGRPGLAHDYTVNPSPLGHPIDSPVRLYDVVPPSRRATPA